MARVVTPTINRTVTYYNTSGLPKPGVITGVVSGTTVNLRIEHVATQVSIVLGPRDGVSPRTNCWMVK